MTDSKNGEMHGTDLDIQGNKAAFMWYVSSFL